MLTPVIIGFGIGYLALGAFLAAAIVTGQLMANFLSNSGGAWDNAKKYIEDGHEGGKGSEAHKAAVIGDTVGDPFKDTAGPALNPLIKVMNLVSLLMLPAILTLRDNNVRYVIAAAALVVVLAAIAYSKAQGGSGIQAASPSRSPARSPASTDGLRHLAPSLNAFVPRLLRALRRGAAVGRLTYAVRHAARRQAGRVGHSWALSAPAADRSNRG